MSCISQILKHTKNEPYMLAIKDRESLVIEGGGEYKGFEYIITFTPMGHRCGYVAIPHDHKLNDLPERVNSWRQEPEIDYYAANIDCHGGLTFGSRTHYIKKMLGVECDDIWIGFDCNHSCDARDHNGLMKYYGADCDTFKMLKKWPDIDYMGTVRDFDYVKNECKNIIDQLTV